MRLIGPVGGDGEGPKEAEDDEGVLAWFDRELPRCMALMPRRRRPQFLKGVYAMFEEVRVKAGPRTPGGRRHGP
jgi:hypothetical protein